MKIHLAHPERGRPDVEPLWLITLAATGLVGLGWLLLALPTPQCMFHAMTGIPCPTCGGTRCIRDLLAGDFQAAFLWNPLVLTAVFAAVIYGFYAAAVTLLRLPRVRLRGISPAQARFIRIAAAVAFAANWIYLVYRFSSAA